jgi:hypothetical protein
LKCFIIDASLFRELAQHCNQLTHLDLSYCYITDAGLNSVVRGCAHLKVLEDKHGHDCLDRIKQLVFKNESQISPLEGYYQSLLQRLKPIKHIPMIGNIFYQAIRSLIYAVVIFVGVPIQYIFFKFHQDPLEPSMNLFPDFKGSITKQVQICQY